MAGNAANEKSLWGRNRDNRWDGACKKVEYVGVALGLSLVEVGNRDKLWNEDCNVPEGNWYCDQPCIHEYVPDIP